MNCKTVGMLEDLNKNIIREDLELPAVVREKEIGNLI